jgi:hypothetical protein
MFDNTVIFGGEKEKAAYEILSGPKADGNFSLFAFIVRSRQAGPCEAILASRSAIMRREILAEFAPTSAAHIQFTGDLASSFLITNSTNAWQFSPSGLTKSRRSLSVGRRSSIGSTKTDSQAFTPPGAIAGSVALRPRKQ